ncbi:MAG: universal stress protein [Cyclobacteriaceae bacterium]|nr:universal stress protein [Cyclobacteriaceae bacterium]
MKRYKNILVALNLTRLDKPVIKYASIIGNMAKAKNIYFMYIKRGLNIPKDIMVQYPELQPLKEFAESSMTQAVSKNYENKSEEILYFDAIEGDPKKELLTHIGKKEIDLVVLGRKSNSLGTRKLPLKIAQSAPCSVLIVPEKSSPTVNTILVPLDFSKNSLKAMNVAIALAATHPNATIECLHVYQLPIGYSKTGKTETEFAEIMEENAKKSWQKFIAKIDQHKLSISINYVLNNKPAMAIKAHIEKKKIDLAVVGARGLSKGAGMLLGSVTEELILTTKVPIMAVKKKGEGIKFLKALIKYI